MIKLYYLLKPLIPRRIQLTIRSFIVKYKAKKNTNIWPILESAGTHPNNWQGWPDNKKFALILTHDVEHMKGYNRVIKLMNVVKELGFVGSFNFVPERDYKVDKELLQTIKQNGFEYGLHGLYHDGKEFQSEKEFFKRAKKMNYYLKDWGAVGFRAPSMIHNLEWIGELNIEYDLSTFDTDPFEPQPDGVGTIFPFFIERKNGKSYYLEMPYTLVQDSTLFLLLKEKSLKIWIDKLDWIVNKGGMVLLNVHPDYINFDNGYKHEEYPIKNYVDFLKYIKSKYPNQFWNPLPREVAEYFKNNYFELRMRTNILFK